MFNRVACGATRRRAGELLAAGRNANAANRPRPFVEGGILTAEGGLDMPARDLAARHLAGGRISAVIDGLAARREGFQLEFAEASAIDLAGQNVEEFVANHLRQGLTQPLRADGEDT